MVNLSEVFNLSTKELVLSLPIGMKCFEGSLGSFDVSFASPLEIRATSIEKGKARVTGKAGMSFEATCDRCLKPAEVKLSIDFEREVCSPDFDFSEEEELRDFMEGFQLDVDSLLYDEITINWPVKILCREDCKGLCPVCGHDLNEGDCGCDTFVPDPRMAALKDIFETTKEV